MTALVCFCTCPDLASAEGIAATLVGRRLAACVNVLPGLRSVYRWQGAIQHDDEVLLLIKTTREQLEPLTASICSLHPNELPEVIAVEVAGGLQAYLDWIVESTQGVQGNPTGGHTPVGAGTQVACAHADFPADPPPCSGV